VVMRGRSAAITVHSLGAKDTKGGHAELIDATGKVVATTRIPPLAAPLDLKPKTATVKLAVPSRLDPATLAIRVALTGDEPEITQANNSVALTR